MILSRKLNQKFDEKATEVSNSSITVEKKLIEFPLRWGSSELYLIPRNYICVIFVLLRTSAARRQQSQLNPLRLTMEQKLLKCHYNQLLQPAEISKKYSLTTALFSKHLARCTQL